MHVHLFYQFSSHAFFYCQKACPSPSLHFTSPHSPPRSQMLFHFEAVTVRHNLFMQGGGGVDGNFKPWEVSNILFCEGYFFLESNLIPFIIYPTFSILQFLFWKCLLLLKYNYMNEDIKEKDPFYLPHRKNWMDRTKKRENEKTTCHLLLK